MKVIVIAKDFSSTPGARYIKESKFSGEQFRQEHLLPLFESQDNSEKVLIDFDGADGYATSFLEEAFGGLARIVGKEKVLKKFEFKSEEDPFLIDEVNGYINDVG